ncbi:MAG: hypothetical protein US70_C0019G0001 [Parcubacteria group bacterium GW2011_GWD2_38_11]|nr:MAG: hypothetical protein US70_C0019G0001 [Parcubacteria group bacterium GW2011_GWD2_38_11]
MVNPTKGGKRQCGQQDSEFVRFLTAKRAANNRLHATDVKPGESPTSERHLTELPLIFLRLL